MKAHEHVCSVTHGKKSRGQRESPSPAALPQESAGGCGEERAQHDRRERQLMDDDTVKSNAAEQQHPERHGRHTW